MRVFELSDAIKREVLYKSNELSFQTHVDRLNCKESWMRQGTNMSFNEFIKSLPPNPPIYIHERNGFLNEPHKYFNIGSEYSLGDNSLILFVKVESGIFEAEVINKLLVGVEQFSFRGLRQF